MSGTSDLVKIARGEKDATRLEVAHAFGEWCHSGGQAHRAVADVPFYTNQREVWLIFM